MNSRSFNSQRYENYLSTFGKKVLGNLFKNFMKSKHSLRILIIACSIFILAQNQSREGSECNKIQVRGRYNGGQNKRILNFGDSYVSVGDNETDNNVFDKQSEFTDPYEIEMPVITSQELLKPATEDKITGKEHAFIAVKNDASDNSVNSLAVVKKFSKGRVSDNIHEVKDHIQWDDIFDSQLFNDLRVLDSDSKINAEKEITEKTNLIRPCVEYDKNVCSGNLSSMTANILNKTDNLNTDCRHMLNFPTADLKTNRSSNDNDDKSNVSEYIVIKKSKVKRSSANKTTNVIPKKVKISPDEVPKNSFRKQKYTKAVKIWLNNVEHDIFENDMELQINKNTIPEEIIPDNQEEKINVKKNIQAQLTNKGGIMKFGKPKHNVLSEKPKAMEPFNNTVNSVTTAIKEKKAKLKFVAPVKSQIPVKNILYNVINLNDDSSKEYVTELSAVNEQEIYMILTFSNGFCQLNSHYSESTCVVDGVMFEINNVVYYWKHIYKTICDTMEKLMHRNIIVCYDGKNLLKYFTAQCDINIKSIDVKVLDLQIGGNLVDPNNPLNNFTNLQKLLSFVPEYTVATECVEQKCAWYLTVLRDCFGKLRAVLVDYQLWHVFVEIEMPVLPIIAEMEERGVRVDSERLQAMDDVLMRQMQAAERGCYAAAGRTFQLNSVAQVRTILYEELRLDVRGNVKVRETLCKGDKSTSEATLRSLMTMHPLPRLILEYRHVHKAHATFVAGIANQVVDGFIKPTWEQTAAVTGRIACNNPNLQAIPKGPFSLVLFPAETNEEEFLTVLNETLNFRSVYIPSEGHVLLAADFKHIECRVFAYAAADTSLLEALASPDLFRVLAAKWLSRSEREVCGADRERTKRMVYASLYGAGARRLAHILALDYDGTLNALASFNRTFPSLKRFGRGVVARCERGAGRLTTLCGRARTFPNIFSGDSTLRAQAERQAINFVVQGCAADLCKLAMVAAARRLQRTSSCTRLLLQLHDELVWEVPRGDLAHAAADIKSAMEGVGAACGVHVPLPVAVSVGQHWGAMEDYPPPMSNK